MSAKIKHLRQERASYMTQLVFYNRTLGVILGQTDKESLERKYLLQNHLDRFNQYITTINKEIEDLIRGDSHVCQNKSNK